MAFALRTLRGVRMVRCLATARVNPATRKDLNWGSMLFEYRPTDAHVEFTFREGKWDAGVLRTTPYIQTHIMSAVFHYGQCLFEGLKVHEGKDGSVRLFQPDNLNAKRMQLGCERLSMPVVPTEMFNSAISRAVRANLDYVPPYGHGASLYVRPFVFGCGSQLGLGPAPEYKFIVAVCPVGSYYKGGLSGVSGLVMQDYDRAAPLGTGHVKAGGNYAADLVPSQAAKKAGFPIALYLDAATHSYIEEFSTSNFCAITKAGAYITPESRSVLDSVTNRCLFQAAKDLGLVAERRPIKISEVETFAEVGAVGTAVVLTPVTSLTRGSTTHSFPTFSTLQRIRTHVVGIQTGEVPDKHGWLQDL
eukprot:m.387419 g.387419  ORF g.387419 m.387419 type:complete len:361 (-) comp56314_c0_seq10:220-1302(-)